LIPEEFFESEIFPPGDEPSLTSRPRKQLELEGSAPVQLQMWAMGLSVRLFEPATVDPSSGLSYNKIDLRLSKSGLGWGYSSPAQQMTLRGFRRELAPLLLLAYTQDWNSKLYSK
jgi:hypothetical protein